MTVRRIAFRLLRQYVIFLCKSLDFVERRVLKRPDFDTYCQHGLISYHYHDFMRDGKFMRAYAEGAKAVWPQRPRHWKVHIGVWAAVHAKSLAGDYVECGVHKGALSLTIMHYLDWNTLGDRRFYLLDTFCGIDEKYLSETERAKGLLKFSRQEYKGDYFEETRNNFRGFRNVIFVRGSVPETLTRVDTQRVCYLSLDMNNAKPEIDALNYFWDRLATGAIVLMDDYGVMGFEEQKKEFNTFASKMDVPILALPTGQGVIIRP